MHLALWMIPSCRLLLTPALIQQNRNAYLTLQTCAYVTKLKQCCSGAKVPKCPAMCRIKWISTCVGCNKIQVKITILQETWNNWKTSASVLKGIFTFPQLYFKNSPFSKLSYFAFIGGNWKIFYNLWAWFGLCWNQWQKSHWFHR